MKKIDEPKVGEETGAFHMRVANDVVDNFNEVFERLEKILNSLEAAVCWERSGDREANQDCEVK